MNGINLTTGRISRGSRKIIRFLKPKIERSFWITIFAIPVLFSGYASFAQDPTLTLLESSSLSYNEGQAATPITNTIVVSDSDSPLLASATIQITGNYSSTEDQLLFAAAFSITASYDQLTGTLTLMGPASASDFTNALRTVTYNNTNNDNPSNL